MRFCCRLTRLNGSTNWGGDGRTQPDRGRVLDTGQHALLRAGLVQSSVFLYGWPIAGVQLISGLWGLITGSNSQATRLELEQHMHLSLLKEQQRSSQAVFPQCQKVIVYDRSLAGLGVRCGGCGHQFQVF